MSVEVMGSICTRGELWVRSSSKDPQVTGDSIVTVERNARVLDNPDCASELLVTFARQANSDMLTHSAAFVVTWCSPWMPRWCGIRASTIASSGGGFSSAIMLSAEGIFHASIFFKPC